MFIDSMKENNLNDILNAQVKNQGNGEEIMSVANLAYRARLFMGTNKERIEHLESGLGAVQEGLQRMEISMNDKLHHVEEALNRLLNVLPINLKSSNHGNHHRENQDGGRYIVSSKSAKLEFPRFSGDDPT
ncbi:hypothetical protein Pint_30954 [Pistacia integerrima]|uniref:Uncharacterized protein n=1 Tax=Pistacia integerrima TaxID=434235 RepID=A0ACC0XLX2_9ROSI|nr:hypothetical protein Pint_30954 [Pistacia integerrima]